MGAEPSKAERQADEALVVGYHEARLADLLERVREGFERYDAGELDAFELDELVHRYKKAARELWKFCGDRTRGDLGCPAVPGSPIMKEILGKSMGL